MTGDTPPLFLTNAELEFMRGYKQKTATANWCRKNGIEFFRDAPGLARHHSGGVGPRHHA
jgi:hypothetical protein